LPNSDYSFSGEEGLFVNLAKKEQKLLEKIYLCAEAKKGKSYKDCREIMTNGAIISNMRLITVRSGMAVAYLNNPNFVRNINGYKTNNKSNIKGKLFIYDIERQRILEELQDTGNFAFSSDYIIRVESLANGTQVLQLYRPGMLGFININNSEIDTKLKERPNTSLLKYNSYLKDGIFSVYFSGNSIRVKHYLYNFTQIKNPLNKFSFYTTTFVFLYSIHETSKTFDFSEINSDGSFNTENWITCSNNKQGYQISYPEDWFVVSGREISMPLIKIVKKCQNGVDLVAQRPAYKELKFVNLSVKLLSLPERQKFETEEYLSENLFLNFPSVESDLVIFRKNESNENYKIKDKFLIFSNDKRQAWQITIIGESREFIETVINTFKIIPLTPLPPTPENPLAKIQGKNRLYTEEEGKYENLTEEEQQVFVEAYYCRQYNKNGKKACMHNIEVYGLEINNKARLIALKDGMVVFYSEGEGMPKGRLYIYDLKNGELVREIIDSGYIAFGPDFIIMAENLSQNSQVLQLYRPGMSDFIDIPDSQSQGAEYVDRSDQFNRVFPIEFGINSITTYLHTFKNCVDIGGDFAPGFYECEVDTKVPKTFDLSNLP